MACWPISITGRNETQALTDRKPVIHSDKTGLAIRTVRLIPKFQLLFPGILDRPGSRIEVDVVTASI